MNTAVKLREVKIKDVNITEDTITAYLIDGRVISVSCPTISEQLI